MPIYQEIAKFSLVFAVLTTGAHAVEPCHTASKVRFFDIQNKEKAAYAVELAADETTQEKGLMFRTKLDADKGMWFVFDHSYRVAMWMKNTLIPLDMVFVDEAGVVRYIEHEAKPETLTIRQTPSPARYVLEIAGGQAKAHHLAPGDRVRCEAAPQAQK